MPASRLFKTVMSKTLTRDILIGLVLGGLTGIIMRNLPLSEVATHFITNNIFQLIGTLFINLLRMLVVPLVFISLVCGCAALNNAAKLGRIGIKTVLLYLITTALAITIAILLANIFHIGNNLSITAQQHIITKAPPSLREMIINIIPTNPVNAMAQGNMLQLIFFSLLFGFAIMLTGKHGKRIRDIFDELNKIMMQLVAIVMNIAPYGIFFLIATVFTTQGIQVLYELLQYVMLVIFALAVHAFFSYGLILKLIGNLNPFTFYKKMFPAALFAFSVSSSNASIPVVLETVEDKLGVDNSVAAFVVPLGATINMDGTAIMQGVATVFIANAYHIQLGPGSYMTIILMATLASIGAAGVPSVGLITLSMVFEQLGLPLEGIALILSVDRILDMLRTSVNITGDAMVSCLVGKSEKLINLKKFNK